MYLDSKNKKRFGLIHTVIDPSKVVLTVIKGHKRIFQQYTTRQLLLLYRSTEWIAGHFSAIQ